MDEDRARQYGRHRVVEGLLLAHIPVFVILGLRAGWSISHTVTEVVLPLVGFWAFAHYAHRRRLAMGAGGIGLMYASAVLVHVTGGVTEAHFYFFVAFGLVALYRDWVVFFAAAAFAVGHHIVFALAGGVLFRQPYQVEDPLLWATVHITFVTIVTAVQAVGMYDVARRVRDTERLKAAMAVAEERRRAALSIHDGVVQSLATASWARSLGDDATASAALEKAMESSQRLVTGLLGDSPVDARALTRTEQVPRSVSSQA